VPLSAVIECKDKSDFLGYQAFQQKDYAAAEQYFDKALQYNPQNEEATLLMVQVKLQLNKPQEALPYANRYLQLYPASPLADQINSLIANINARKR
jgi:Tfp pilus assembly protein PilF